jgi:hypothetical protein
VLDDIAAVKIKGKIQDRVEDSDYRDEKEENNIIICHIAGDEAYHDLGYSAESEEGDDNDIKDDIDD